MIETTLRNHVDINAPDYFVQYIPPNHGWFARKHDQCTWHQVSRAWVEDKLAHNYTTSEDISWLLEWAAGDLPVRPGGSYGDLP